MANPADPSVKLLELQQILTEDEWPVALSHDPEWGWQYTDEHGCTFKIQDQHALDIVTAEIVRRLPKVWGEPTGKINFN